MPLYISRNISLLSQSRNSSFTVYGLVEFRLTTDQGGDESFHGRVVFDLAFYQSEFIRALRYASSSGTSDGIWLMISATRSGSENSPPHNLFNSATIFESRSISGSRASPPAAVNTGSISTSSSAKLIPLETAREMAAGVAVRIQAKGPGRLRLDVMQEGGQVLQVQAVRGVIVLVVFQEPAGLRQQAQTQVSKPFSLVSVGIRIASYPWP